MPSGVDLFGAERLVRADDRDTVDRRRPRRTFASIAATDLGVVDALLGLEHDLADRTGCRRRGSTRRRSRSRGCSRSPARRTAVVGRADGTGERRTRRRWRRARDRRRSRRAGGTSVRASDTWGCSREGVESGAAPVLPDRRDGYATMYVAICGACHIGWDLVRCLGRIPSIPLRSRSTMARPLSEAARAEDARQPPTTSSSWSGSTPARSTRSRGARVSPRRRSTGTSGTPTNCRCRRSSAWSTTSSRPTPGRSTPISARVVAGFGDCIRQPRVVRRLFVSMLDAVPRRRRRSTDVYDARARCGTARCGGCCSGRSRAARSTRDRPRAGDVLRQGSVRAPSAWSAARPS